MKVTTQEERYMITKMVEQGMTSKEIGLALGYSKKAIDKWRSRIRSSKMESKMGRPPSGPMGGIAEVLRSQVKGLREEHPLWGARMIHCELGDTCARLPSPSTLHRYMKQQGLIEGNERRGEQVPFPRIEARVPHDVWQIDGQGNEQVIGLGTYSILNAKDVFSGLHVGVHPVRMKSERGHPTTRDYQAAVRYAAMNHGLPKQIQSDHASVFYDNHSKSPFPTLFFLWLVALDITPVLAAYMSHKIRAWWKEAIRPCGPNSTGLHPTKRMSNFTTTAKDEEPGSTKNSLQAPVETSLPSRPVPMPPIQNDTITHSMNAT